ncbi:MAG: hypothetical protein M3R53_10735 [Candidatus Eremiobacteraeota bacterium]|nr:hypothetical protein [Candidatus Eremiobacteraeota bacterium]
MPRSLTPIATFLLVLTTLVPVRAVVPYLLSPAFAVSALDDAEKSDPPAAKNAGSIDGQVTSVDYAAGKMSVKAANMRYDVIVLPSTSIHGKASDTFHTIADIHKGAHVQVIMSQRAGTYTAQIIRLL